MFYKIVSNYIKEEKSNYDRVINRRKERFLELVELHAPKEIIIKEIDLLRQPFKYYIAKSIKDRVSMILGKSRSTIL